MSVDRDDDASQSCMPRLATFLSGWRQTQERLHRIAEGYDAETGCPLHDDVAQPQSESGWRDHNSASLPPSELKLEWMQDIQPRLTAGGTLIKGLLDEGAMSVVYAPPNAGKTFFGLDIAYHVATGEPWRDCKVRKRGCVVYIASEGGYGIANRLAALKIHHGLKLDEGVPLAVIRSPVNLLAPDADTPRLVHIIKTVEREYTVPVVLVVVDTLSRSLAGGDENGPKDMTAFVRNVDRIRHETAAHVMVLHHSGKDAAKGARGHNSLLAATDTEISLVPTGPGKRCAASVTKQRDMPGGEQFPFDLLSVDIGTDEDGTPVSSAVVIHLVDDPTPQHGAEVAEAIMASPRIDAALTKGRAVAAATGVPAGAPEAGDDPPEGVLVARVADWRAAVLDGVPDERRNAQRGQFDRDLQGMVKRGQVATAGERLDRVYWFPE